jgi:hypothetical protein
VNPLRALALPLALALLAPALTAMQVSDKVAYVQSREADDDGKIVKVKVKILKAGVYHVAAGYVVDRDARFQFLEGKKSGVKYYEVRKVDAIKDDVTVEIIFPLKGKPPLVECKLWAAVYDKLEKIPVTTP